MAGAGWARYNNAMPMNLISVGLAATRTGVSVATFQRAAATAGLTPHVTVDDVALYTEVDVFAVRDRLLGRGPVQGVAFASTQLIATAPTDNVEIERRFSSPICEE